MPDMEERTSRKTRIGRVVSDKMDKTRVVAVEHTFKHKRYKKIIRRTSKMYAHDEANQSHEGDLVKIIETRPLSKQKRWRVTDIVEQAK